MKTYSGWKGTDKDILYLVSAILHAGSPSLADSYPELTEREVKSLFCAALASNVVTSEIAESMSFQFENGEDGSERRRELNELRNKYLARTE